MRYKSYTTYIHDKWHKVSAATFILGAVYMLVGYPR